MKYVKKLGILSLAFLTIFLVSCEDKISTSEYQLTYHATAGGYVSGYTSQTIITGESGKDVIAIANNGYTFTSWSDGETERVRQETNVQEDITVTAQFVEITYELTYKANVGGYFILNDKEVTEYSETVHGTAETVLQEIEAFPKEGYTFVGWSDGVKEAKRSDTHITSNQVLTASFSANENILTYKSDLGGSLEVNGVNQGTSYEVSKNSGEKIEITAVADAYSTFIMWDDGVTTATRTDDITKSFVVRALFKPKAFIADETLFTSFPEDYKYNQIILKTNEYELTIENLIFLFTKFEIVNLQDAIIIEDTIPNNAFLQTSSSNYFMTKDLILPNTLKTIGSNAFKSCITLEKVRLSDSIETIGTAAFIKCSSLYSMNLPNNETYDTIEQDLFSETGLEFVSYDRTALNGLILNENIKNIGKNAFKSSKALQSVILEDTIISIGVSAFDNCTSLTYAVLPENDEYTAIENTTFTKTGFKTITYDENATEGLILNKSITSIGTSAFSGCSQLVSVTLDDVITVIMDSAFYNCKSLIYIKMPSNESYIKIEKNTFYSSALQQITYDVNALHGIILNDNITIFGADAFSGAQIKVAEIGKNVVTLNQGATKTSNDLTAQVLTDYKYTLFYKVSEENSVYSSIDGVLYNKDQTEVYSSHVEGDIVLPESVTNIAVYAFANSPTRKVVGAKVTALSENSFYIASIVEVDFPLLTSLPKRAFYKSTSLADISSMEPNLINIGEEAFFGNIGLTSLDLPKVTTLGKKAFSGCTGLTTLNTPVIETIGIEALANCSGLVNFNKEYNGFNYVPDTITEINEGAFMAIGLGNIAILKPLGIGVFELNTKKLFQKSLNLTSVALPINITKFDESMFVSCPAIDKITYGDLSNVNNEITEINKFAFNESNITNAFFPKLEKIVGSAFFNSNLRYFNVDVLGLNHMPATIKSIPKLPFQKTKLANMVFEGDITLEAGSFSDNTELITLVFKTMNAVIKDGAFANCEIKTIIVPAGSKEYYFNQPGLANYLDFIEEEM